MQDLPRQAAAVRARLQRNGAKVKYCTCKCSSRTLRYWVFVKEAKKTQEVPCYLYMRNRELITEVSNGKTKNSADAM